MKRISLLSVILCLALNSFAQDAPATTPKSSEAAPKSDVYEFVEVEAQFPGGEESLMNYLVEHIKYPRNAQQHEVSGRVIISFIIDDEGNVTNVHESHSSFTVPKKDQKKDRDEDKYALVAEAMRVIRLMPKWTPGKMNGKAVNSTMTLPIVFALK